MAKTKEQRIRDIAKRKVRVNITTRTRSSEGFEVGYPGLIGIRIYRTKAEALSALMAAVQCHPRAEFYIKPVRRER